MSSGRKEDDAPEPFPALSPVTEELPAIKQDHVPSEQPQRRSSTTTPGSPRRSRVASLRQNLIDTNPPLGAWQAIGQDTSKIPTLPEIKNGSFSADGWSHEGQLEKRNYNPHDIHKRRLSRSSQSQGSGNRSTRPSTANAHAVPEELEALTEAKSSQLLPSQQQHTESSESHTAFKEKTDISPDPKRKLAPVVQTTTAQSIQPTATGPDETGTYPNGYRFPKKHTWKQALAIFGKAFWKFFLTPTGFLVTVYGLNVVAWGAMIFFLLIPGATPAMCKSYPDCNNKTYSARQIWIENTSQILNALFCVTGFGLLPWRARDFYLMIRTQVIHDHDAHRKLAGFYSGWYRLPESDKLPEDLSPPPKPAKGKKAVEIDLEKRDKMYTEGEMAELLANPAVPLPVYRMAPAPLTGIRAPPTGFKKLAWMIWMYIWNTLFQVCLCFVMWHFTKYNRPSWATATFIVCGCGTGAVAGGIAFTQGKKIKEIEGIPVKDYDVEETPEDFHERMAKKQKKIDKKNLKSKTKENVRVGSEE